MNNIKVTVEYEQPKTDSFFNLLQSYEEVKKLSAETVSYYKPLAEMAEQAKMTAILEQLETIQKYLVELNKLNSAIQSVTAKHYSNHGGSVEFRVDLIDNRIYWLGILFTLENLASSRRRFNGEISDDYNILGNWDKWKMYKQLEDACIRMLNKEIEKQKSYAENEKSRLTNITGEV